MSDRLEIRKDGLYELEWDREQKVWLPTHKPDPDTIFTQLRTSCTIQEGVTLGDIFNMMDQYPLLKDFIAQYSWCPDLEKYHMNATLDREDDGTVTHLEISHVADSDSHVERVKHKGGKRETTIAISYKTWDDFIGIGPCTPDMIEMGCDPADTMRYSMSATQPYQMAHLKVVLKEEFAVYLPYDRSRSIDENNREILKISEDFSLLDILDVIYWDISFYGGPENNETGDAP